MRKEVKYFIAYYGPDGNHKVWSDIKNDFVPAGMHLWYAVYDTIEDAMKACRAVRKACSGWHDDIYIDSYLTYREDVQRP